MKHYHILECSNQQVISQELYSFLNKPTGPLNQPLTKFWNFLDKKIKSENNKEIDKLSFRKSYFPEFTNEKFNIKLTSWSRKPILHRWLPK